MESREHTFFNHEVQLELPIPLYLVTLLVFLAEDVGMDIFEPDFVSATTFDPVGGGGLICN